MEPVNSIELLGAVCCSNGRILRVNCITRSMRDILKWVSVTPIGPDDEIFKRVRGFLDYYGGFAGQVHTVIYSWLLPGVAKRIVQFLDSKSISERILIKKCFFACI